MLFNRMFRERALEHRVRQEPLDDRLQITAPHEWLIVAGLGLMLLVLITYGVFVRVERTASYDAVLILPGERHYLVAPVSGTVVDVLVEVTDTVVLGQPIAYVQTPGGQQRGAVIGEIINALEKSGQLEEGSRKELLQALLDVGSGAESAPESKIVSPHGGQVVALDLAPGQAVSAGAFVGLVRTTTAGQPEVVAFVSPDDAGYLRVGMEASVSVGSLGGGDERVLPGRVIDVSPRTDAPPRWLADQGLAIPQRPHQLRVALADDEPDLPMADGIGVSLQIVLGRESLASVLVSGSGG